MRPGPGLTFDGQSLIHAPAAGRGLAALVMDELDSHTAFVVAVGGTTYATRAANAAGRSWWSFANTALPVLVDAGGTSDLLGSLTAAQIVAAMESYHTAAKAAGAALTVACTVPPMTAAWGFTGAMETVRVALNPLILASGVFDAVADIAAVPEAADPANATWYSDGLHPTAALAALFADVIVDALATIGVS